MKSSFNWMVAIFLIGLSESAHSTETGPQLQIIGQSGVTWHGSVDYINATSATGPLYREFFMSDDWTGYSAYANYGVLKTFAASIGYGDNQFYADSTASWRDDITITIDGNGSGVAHIPIIIDGILTTNFGSANRSQNISDVIVWIGNNEALHVSTTVLLSETRYYVNNPFGLHSNPEMFGIWDLYIPFTSGSPINVTVTASCSNGVSGDVIGTGYDILACNMGNSVYWGGVASVANSDGTPARLISVTSASGTNYLYSFKPATVDSVPEPATWAMLVAGFGAIGGAMRRRRVEPILADS